MVAAVRRLLVTTTALVLAAACTPTGTSVAEQTAESVRAGEPGTTGSAAPAASPTRRQAFLEPVPADPVLDQRSDRIAAHLGAGPWSANVTQYGVPVYDADGAPLRDVECLRDWGHCRLEAAPVPVPDDAAPSTGTDAAMAVVDRRTGTSYEFWQVRRDGPSTWVTSWGDVVDLSPDVPSVSSATGAGLGLVDGLVTPQEIASGTIRHALVFSTDNACAGDFRAPATKTDGTSDRDDCIPQGARVQLDPAVDLSAIDGLSPAELAVGRALQQYGAYARDNGGTPVALIFQTPAADDDRLARAGLAADYDRLARLPWDRLRVLASWDGGPPASAGR